MFQLNQAATDFFEKLYQCQTLEQCWQLYLQTMQQYGIQHLLYGVQLCQHPKGNYDGVFYLTNYPAEFMHVYEQEQFALYDVSVSWCQNMQTPMIWEQDDIPLAQSKLQRKVDELSRDFGFFYGVTIPLRLGLSPCVSGIGLSATGLSKQAFAPVLQYRLTELVTCTELFQSYIKRFPLFQYSLSPQDKNPMFSNKERDLLYWSAMGLQVEEIADKLHRSKRTVEGYLTQIKRKLGARTMPQAVCHAMLLGVLSG